MAWILSLNVIVVCVCVGVWVGGHVLNFFFRESFEEKQHEH